MASTSTGIIGQASTNAGTHRCEMCDIFFENESFLFSHYQSFHKIDNKYVCNTCNYTHIYLGYVRAHAREDHSHVVTYCGVCDTYLNSLHDYKNHLPVHKFGMSNGFKCDVCEKHFIQFSILVTHYKEDHLHVHVCEMCNVSWENNDSLLSHYHEYHKRNNTFVCNKCDYKTLRPSHLKIHVTVNHTYVMKYCVICDKHFYSAPEYNNHKNVHISGTLFRCSLCMTVNNFSTFVYLVRHYKRMHL